MYKLTMEKKVIQFVTRLQSKQYKQVVNKILSLQENPRPQDCKQLEGYKGGYRVDQGEYRILYTIDEVDVHTWHTKIKLKGIIGKFNSVCFKLVD